MNEEPTVRIGQKIRFRTTTDYDTPLRKGMIGAIQGVTFDGRIIVQWNSGEFSYLTPGEDFWDPID